MNNDRARHAKRKPQRIQKIAADIILLTVGLAFAYGGYSVIRAVSSASGKWHGHSQVEWLLVAVTSGYVIVTTFQWRAMQGTLEVTRESNALMQRAWLIVDDIVVAAWFNDVLDIRFTITNVGKIPATQIQIADYSKVYPDEAPWPLPLPSDGGLAEATIGPGHGQNFTVKSCITTPEERGRVLKSSSAILALGLAIRYTDAIDSKGLTQVNGFFSGVRGTWKYAPAGNAVV